MTYPGIWDNTDIQCIEGITQRLYTIAGVCVCGCVCVCVCGCVCVGVCVCVCE